jgi:hypothetical protein
MQSIGEMWARSVNEKTQPQPVQNTAAPVKPVKDNETEKRKAHFRQNILNTNSKQKEQPNE